MTVKKQNKTKKTCGFLFHVKISQETIETRWSGRYAKVAWSISKRPVLLFFWSCLEVQYESCIVTLWNILWHKMSFYTTEFKASNWGFLAWNSSMSSVRKQFAGPNSLWIPPCRPELSGVRGAAEHNVDCLWRLWSLLLEQIDEVYLERSTVRAGKTERETQTEREGEVEGGNGFSSLKGISCYLQDALVWTDEKKKNRNVRQTLPSFREILTGKSNSVKLVTVHHWLKACSNCQIKTHF